MNQITSKNLRYLLLAILTLVVTLPAYAQSSRVVISQVYGGGGNPGATYKNDFIELFNSGDAAQNLTGWTLQYGAATGTTWSVTPLTGTIQPGHYFLVQQASGGGGAVALPAPDLSGAIDVSETTGKVALVRDSGTLAGACPTDMIVDFVGYGAANCYEGMVPASVLTNTTADIRVGGGCTDGNWNGTDFGTGSPAPRNSSTPTQTCIAIGTFGRLSTVSLPEGNSGTTPFNFSVELNVPAKVPVTFNASTQNGTATAPSDFTALSNVPFTIPVGQQSTTVTVLVNGDTIPEANENFTVVLSAINGASPTIPTLQLPGVIMNDDTGPVSLSLSPSLLPAGLLGVAYSQVLTVPGGTTCAFTTSGTLPPGLSLSSTGILNTATLSGTLSSSGTFGFTVNAGCTNGSASQAYSVSVGNSNLSFSPSLLPAGTVATPYSQVLTVTNGGACKFATSGTVPSGLSLSSTGLTNTATLSGTPSSSGTFGFTVSANCASGPASQAYSVSIAGASLSFSPSSLPSGTVAVPYSQVLTVPNGGACTFTTSGTVPPGLSLGSTGQTNTATLGGTPSSSGTFGFTVSAGCANGSASQAYSFNVTNSTLSFSPSSLPAGTVGAPYSQLLTVTNGATCKFTVSGATPSGLNLGSTGLTNTATLSGTPSTSGTSGFTVNASCANGAALQAYSVNVAAASLSFSPSSIPGASLGVPYSQVLTVLNGGACKFAASGTVPTGISLSSTGLTNTATLSGTPSSSGTYGFTVSANCANGPASQAYLVNVAGAGLSFSPSSLPAGNVGLTYSQVLTVTNGGACSFTVSGTVPPGLSLGYSGQSNTAMLIGKPSPAGTYGFTVSASCANGSASQAYSVIVSNGSLSFSSSSLPAGTTGTPYSQVLTVANGSTCNFTPSGALPTGLSLGSTGLTNTATVGGTPSSAGSFAFTIIASCANGTASQAYSISVSNPSLTFSPSSLPSGSLGQPYSQVLTAINGGACKFATSGTVPTGLSLSSTGLTNTATLSGTPSSPGTFGFTVTANCANGPASQTYSVSVSNAGLSFSPSSLPAGTVGVTYLQVLTVTNGGACKFTVSGTVPPGLSLGYSGQTNTAMLIGKPSPAGTFAFAVSASCANGSAAQAYSVNVSNTATNSLSKNASDSASFVCESGVKTSTAIHTIQGSGAVSPMVGQTVEVEGIVVGHFQSATQLGGFYLQEPDATWDSDPLTSEGIFIYNQIGVSVNVGDRVRVRGVVNELSSAGSFLGTPATSSLTELTAVSAERVCSTGNSFYRTSLTLPIANAGDLERYEGMAVELAQQLTVTGNSSLGISDSIDLAPAQLYAPTASKDQTTWSANASLNQRSVIALDDGSTLTGASLYPTLFPQGGLSATNTLRNGALVNYDPSTKTNSPLLGVLDDRLGEYRVQPTHAVTFYNANARPHVAPILASVGGRFHAASANVLNFFTTLGSRGAANQMEFNEQKTKIIEELSGLNADLYGLNEVQNFANGSTSGEYTNSALQSLVDGLNCKNAGLAPLCTTPPAGPYAFIDTLNLGSNNGTDAIRSAIIYNPSVLMPVGAPAEYYQNDSNRPTLAQTFKPATGAQASLQTFTFVVNHFRSKSSPCGGSSDDTYQGNCNGLRLSMAQNVTAWLSGNPTGDPLGTARRILQVGDFNAYYGEDPIQHISANGYTNLIAAIVGSAAYSYNFGSQAGYLDHTMANAPMNVLVKSVAEWHDNADEPSSLQALDSSDKSPAAQVAYYGDDAFAASDHDPIVIGFNPLAGDLNDDGVVDARDMAILAAALGKPASSVDRRMDLDGDGMITMNDYHLWQNLYRAFTGGN